MRIVIMGPKGAGKSTVGKAFADHVGLPCVDTDTLIDRLDKSVENPDYDGKWLDDYRQAKFISSRLRRQNHASGTLNR